MDNNLHAVNLTAEHIQVINKALEVYYRLRSGQIDIAVDTVYADKLIDYNDRVDISTLIRSIVFPKTVKGGGFGAGSPEIGDGNLAFEIMQTLRQFLAVERNDGYFDSMFVSFDDPFKITDVPLPSVEGFTKSKRFYVDDEYTNTKLREHIEDSRYDQAWSMINEYLKGGVPAGEWSRIKFDEGSGEFYLEVFKPQKKLTY